MGGRVGVTVRGVWRWNGWEKMKKEGVVAGLWLSCGDATPLTD